MPRQKQSNPKALKQQREEVKLLLKDGPSTQESGTGKPSSSGSKRKTKNRNTGERKTKHMNISGKTKNKRMVRGLREKKSSDKNVTQLQDKGNNNMQIQTKDTDVNQQLIEQLSTEPAKKDKYDLIKERSARTTKQTNPKENSPKKSPTKTGHHKVIMPQKGSLDLPQDTGQFIEKDKDVAVNTAVVQKDTEQEAADKQQALEALLHISGVELNSFSQEKKESQVVETGKKSTENKEPVKEQYDVPLTQADSPGQDKNVSSESSNVLRIDETEIGVKYQLKSDSLEEQGLKLTYTAPTAADYDLNPVSYGVYRPNRPKSVITLDKQDSDCAEFDKDKGKRIGKHVCEFCGRRCLKPSVLKKHIRSHTGERPYPCIPCGFSFKTKSNLYKHRKSHAHAIKAGITPNLEGIKVMEDDENDSEETESEDEMEIDEGVDAINDELDERLHQGKRFENITKAAVEESLYIGKNLSGIPGQTSLFSGEAPHTPATIGRHRLTQVFPLSNPSPSEARVMQGEIYMNRERIIKNSVTENQSLLTMSSTPCTSLSPVVNKGSKTDTDKLSREQSQGDTGCGQVLDNLRSKDVAGFRIDMETGRAMPILHTQLGSSDQPDAVTENPEKKIDDNSTNNDIDSAKLMIPLTNFSIVKSGGQFHVQIPVQGILESAIVKDSENLLTDKTKDVSGIHEKRDSIDIEKIIQRTPAISEKIVSNKVKSHLPFFSVGDTLKTTQFNYTSTDSRLRTVGNESQTQPRSRSISESIIMSTQPHSRSSQGLPFSTTPFSQVSVVSSQLGQHGTIASSIFEGNKMWPQPKTNLISPRKIATSSPVIQYSPSISETKNNKTGSDSSIVTNKVTESFSHSSHNKPPYKMYPAITLPHDNSPLLLAGTNKHTLLPQTMVSPGFRQQPTSNQSYSRYQTLEETQAALRAAQPKLFKRRKYKSEGDSMPSDLNLPKKRGRKPKHERIAIDRVPTPTRPMAPVPFLPTLPPVPQSPLAISTAGTTVKTPMLSSLHFAHFPSLDNASIRHSMASPSSSVINTNTRISSSVSLSIPGPSSNIHSNTPSSMFSGTTQFTSVQSAPYTSYISTTVTSRTQGVSARVQNYSKIVQEVSRTPEVPAYHPISLQSPLPGPSSSISGWPKRQRGVSPKTQDYGRPRPLMPISDMTHRSGGDGDDKNARHNIESTVSPELKQVLPHPGLLKMSERLSQPNLGGDNLSQPKIGSDSLSRLKLGSEGLSRPKLGSDGLSRPTLGSKPSRKNLTLDIPSFGSLKHPTVTKASKCTTPIEYVAKTLLSPEAFSIAQSVVKLASPMKTKPDGTPTTPVEAARELGRLAAHAAFANAGGKVENILSPMIPSMTTSQGSIVVGPITTPTTSGPQKQFFVLPSPSKTHNPGFPSPYDNLLLKKQVPVITNFSTASPPVSVQTPVQTPHKPPVLFNTSPTTSQVISPKVRSQPIHPHSASTVPQTEYHTVINKSFQPSRSSQGQTIAFVHGLPTYQTKPRLRTSALHKIDETVITNEGVKTIPTPLKYLYKNAVGSHSNTTPMFTCLYRTQPMYVKQQSNYKVSMYSNWRSGSNSLHPLGMSWKAHLGLNDSSRNRRPRMVYMVSPLSKDQNGILTHSSMWRREDHRTNQHNIPNIKQQQTESSSRREINANFPHKLFRHGRTHHRRTESESAVMDCKSKERKMKDLGKHEPLRVPIFEGGFKSNEEYVYVRGRGRGKYVCEECGIRCKKPSMLKKHIRTHTDMRPYKCSICNFAFKTKGNLTKHMKSKAHNKKTVSTGDDADLGNLDDDDDRIDEDDYDNDHQFSDADENEDTDSADGESSEDDEEEDDEVEPRTLEHAFLRRKRSHGSLPDISGFAGSSEYHFSSIDAGSLPSLHSTRGEQNSDSSDGIPARRSLKRSYSESLDKVRKSDNLPDSLKSHFNYFTVESGKAEERKPTRSEVVGKLTQHLTNKNLEKLRAQTQSQPLVTAPKMQSGSNKSFDITQLPLPHTGILHMPTFQPSYGLSVLNINSGLPSFGNQKPAHSIPMGSNYRISAKIHEAAKFESSQVNSVSKLEETDIATRKNVALPMHTPFQKAHMKAASTEPNRFKAHSEVPLKSVPSTESIHIIPPGSVGSVYIPVSSVLQCGIIPPTTAPYSSGQFVFTFPVSHPNTSSAEPDVVLPSPHAKEVQSTSPRILSAKPSDLSPAQTKISTSHNTEERSHGFHKMPFSGIVAKRKRLQASENISSAYARQAQIPDETLKRLKYGNPDMNSDLQSLVNTSRISLSKSGLHHIIEAPQAQFIPPPLPELSSHHSPVLTSSYISNVSRVPLISPMTPSRMSQLPSTILTTSEVNAPLVQHKQLDSYKEKQLMPSSSSGEVSKSTDTAHKRIIEIDNSDAEGIPSPTATRGGFHKCNVCLKDFTKPSQLRIHMRTHADEHPFSCEECSLSFRTRGLLQKHERSPVHFSHVEAVELSTENADDPRPFKCKECSIAFRIPGHLAKHLRSKGHIMAMERQGKSLRHRLGSMDGSPTKDDRLDDQEDENTDSASEGEHEKVVVEHVQQVEYVHQPDHSD
ncbi:uncharacterized protein [Antedon mediterranea]|uniref:uncharacterized protein isoform X2 n=1 Tax=Antedon mediterranea TaxID=105859 RepID=UPI003AF432BF